MAGGEVEEREAPKYRGYALMPKFTLEIRVLRSIELVCDPIEIEADDEDSAVASGEIKAREQAAKVPQSDWDLIDEDLEVDHVAVEEAADEEE